MTYMELTITVCIAVILICFIIISRQVQINSEHEETISALNSQINSLKTENEKTISELNSQLRSIEIDLVTADARLGECNETLKATNFEIEKTINNSSSLANQIAVLEAEKNFLANQVTTFESENSSLKNRLSALKYLIKSSSDNVKELTRQKIQIEKNFAEAQLSQLHMLQSIQKEYDSNLSDHQNKFTYIASLMADYLTLRIKEAEDNLSISKKYHERQRASKIREIREETKSILTAYKEAQYQLDYLLQMYPELNDVINNDGLIELSFKDINTSFEIYNNDPVSKYISRDEWEKLSSSDRNQLALERYLSRPKTNWEIGRDYELYIAHIYELKGYSVDTFGSYMRINDLGRDLIAKKGDNTEIIQCKYWSTKKEIHENHICQLFGTAICYCIENNISIDSVTPVFVTSTVLSQKAKEFANMLKIKVIENIPLKDFPRVKCNIGRDEYGPTEIYHLPMDPLYDSVKISKKGECYCYSVYEAENLGFRRTYKWHGN